MVKARIIFIILGLFTSKDCLAFNMGPWVKFAVMKSRNFHKLSNLTQQTPIEEKLELTPTIKTILIKVNFQVFKSGLSESNTYLNSISGRTYLNYLLQQVRVK